MDLETIVKPLAFETYNGVPVLVLEDFGGESLDHLLGTPIEADQFLELAVGITTAVVELHQQEVVHKDLKPQNILVNSATGQVKLANLGLAFRLSPDQHAAKPSGLIEGSLPYLSPEQTGRINQPVNGRSDLYALGVTFFEMLTGRLPFEATDPLEWVHCHVARAPLPPSALVPEVPEIFSTIVLKLLAKRAEDRYQTAQGLQHDLCRCLSERQSVGRIEPFAVAEYNLTSRFQLPQRLYGREDKVAMLMSALDRVADTGSPELVLVSGYSGVGKSALVHELARPAVRERVFFISGKFDQLTRNIPYSTIIQAFRELVLEILAESEEGIATWRKRLLDALGTNAELIVEVIPPIELVIGPQPPVLELPPVEAQNRFCTVFRRFIGVFSARERPLALFLDDLQWADSATLTLLRDLMTHPETRNLLVIGAYRDNEVSASHALSLTLDQVRKEGVPISDIVLTPLSRDHLAALVSDLLHRSREDVTPLSNLVHEKTAGNPFFALQFLTAFHEERLIAFDWRAGCFRWDVVKIRAKGFTDNVNVIDLMVGKLARLPESTQRALEQLACLGNIAEVALLKLISRRSEDQLHAELDEAVRSGLVLRLDQAYKFSHDRVQVATYSRIPEGERAAMHLGIGRLLASHTAPDELEGKIFEIVNQLDRGAALLTSLEEREWVAELNLIAGERAKRSTAYASGLTYFAAGAALLGEEPWDRRYDLAFALALHRAECEYLTGDLGAAEERLSMLSCRAKNLVDLSAVTCVRVGLYTTLDRSDRAIDACLDYLRGVGIDWSPHPREEEVRQEIERMWQKLGSRSIEELVDLPPMTDPVCRATIDVLTLGEPAALITDEYLHGLIVGRMANLSLEHGNSDGSSDAYLRLAMVLGPHFGDYASGFRFGKLGFDLVEKRGFTRFKARAYLAFAMFVNPWARPIRTSLEVLRRAFDLAQETGDLAFSSFAITGSITILLSEGAPLGHVEREAERAFEFTRRARFGLTIDVSTTQLRFVRTLRGLTPDFATFNDLDFDEGLFEQHLASDPRLALAACWYWIRKLQARFYAGHYTAALVAASNAETLFGTSRCFPEASDYHVYGALSIAALYEDTPPEEQRPQREALLAHLHQLDVWAENCPENFETHTALVGAELARIDGDTEKATQLYEKAIHSARDNGFVHHEALAFETAARFYRARGFALFADTYLREAHNGYLRWGAHGKTRQLERLYPQLTPRSPLTWKQRWRCTPSSSTCSR